MVDKRKSYLRKRNVKPATKDGIATVRLTKKQQDLVEKFIADVFLKKGEFPEDLRLIISEDEVVSEEYRDLVRDNILELSPQRVAPSTHLTPQYRAYKQSRRNR